MEWSRRAWLLGLSAPAWAQAGEESLWRDFLKWYESRPVEDTNPRVSYLEELKRRGIAPAEVERRGTVLERLTQTRWLELMPRFFDRTYKSGAPRFNPEPNAWLVENVRGLKPGAALDVDMGQGRNAVFLSRAGWDVTGFDSSKEGVAVARRAARAAGLKLNVVVDKHENFDYGRQRWDLVVMTYAWVDLRGPLLGRIVESLRPGGRLVYEQMVEMSGGEGAAPWLPRPGETARLFAPLRLLKNEEVTARADWSWRPERLVRVVAEKAP